MAQSLQSAQQSLQQAGQSAGSKPGEGASQSEMGQEFQAGKSGQPKPGSGSSQGSMAKGQKPGGGLGNAGIGMGGGVGPQQPLPGKKKDELVKGLVNDKGQRLSRTYMGTPDPTQDRAAYYSIVPDKVRAAEASLNREEIPTGYKKQVRDYFDSIQIK